MIAKIIYAIGGFIEILLGLRLIFKMIGANPAAPFVSWVYDWTNPLVAPFAGIFGQHSTTGGPGVVTTGVFDWTALVALVVYALIFALLGRLFDHR